ncbi:DMT family transporter [Pseudolysobacter antarcticus]|uniref:DMT family transporter n=1 Tax=Pseudolysobacter antarcticus TaxID=2511995 RepID=A0A411HKK9_9GAMM|nr:DMT family transporter [Pseudolysobacter antarcticus]QBB70944.1 DMT family transporter [Pseudolysobacter antarcticus]
MSVDAAALVDTSAPILLTPPRKARPLAGVLLAAFGAIAFSGKAIIVKLGYRYGADAVTLLALRMLVALPFFGLMALWTRRDVGRVRLDGSDRWRIIGLGFSGYYLASFLDFAGLEYITATLERLILYLTPTLVLLIGMLVFERRASRRQIIALLISYVGVAAAFSHDLHIGGADIALGSVLVFLSALSYSIYLVGSGQLVARVGAMRLTAYASSVACLFCIAQFLLTHSFVVLMNLAPNLYWLALLNGTVCTVLPVLTVMLAIARIGPALAAQIGMIGPVSTIIMSTLLLGEPMGLWQIIGTVLVMSGVFLVTLPKTA